MELGQFDEARADYQRLIDDPPDDAAAYVALVNRGALAIRRRRWDEAVADLRTALDRKPEAVAAYINLALALRQRAEWPGLREGLALLGHQGALGLFAVEAVRRQALADAVAVLDSGIEKQPRVSRLYHERAQLHRLLGNRDRAGQDLVRAVLLATGAGAASTLPEDLLALGQLLHQNGQHQDAVEVYAAVLKLRPQTAITYRLMAEPLLSLKKYDEAGRALDQYLRTVPVVNAPRDPTPEDARQLSKALRARGLIHAHQQDPRAALDCYTQALKVQRDSETLALRGWTYLTLDSVNLALADFDEAVKQRPQNGDAWLGRAEARMKFGKVTEALADAEAGLKQGPASNRMYYNAARVNAQAAGRLATDAGRSARCERQAADCLRRALALTPRQDQAAFWENYVKKDAAFNAIRRGDAMTRLEGEVLKSPR
jgi:tetratricopeptide (TPR) repeat protein